MVTHRCQSKKNKNKKKKKQENKKLEKMKRYYSEKNPQNYHGIWVQNLIKKILYSKRKKTQNYHGPWHECRIWYLLARLYIKRNKDFFGSTLKTFPLEIVEVIEKLEEIKKNIRTWDCGNSRFRVMALWREVTHFYFLQNKYFVENFYTILYPWLC